MPASATHQAKNAARRAKNPPAIRTFSFGSCFSLRRIYPTPRSKNAMSTVKKSEKKMTVDLRVQRSMRNVKMNHPYGTVVSGVIY